MNIERPRILFAWEFGKNLGHLVRLVEIFKSIRARDGTVIWAIPPQYAKHPILPEDAQLIYNTQSFTSPILDRNTINKADSNVKFHSFADVLLGLGFSDTQTLQTDITYWLRIFEKVRPTSVLCDYAPFALLAASSLGIPTFQITNGFDAPPLAFPMFDSTVRGPYIELANARKVAQLDDRITSVGRALGMPRLNLSSFMSWPKLVIDGIPETDPYGSRTSVRYIGPFIQSSITNIPNWPEEKEPDKNKRIFAYLRGSYAKQVLETLKELPATTYCLWPDATSEVLDRFNGPRMRVTQKMQNLPRIFTRTDSVISYGSSGFLNATLLAGKPHLILPTDREKLMFSRRIERLGAGISLERVNQPNLRHQIQRILDNEEFATSAKKISSRYSDSYFNQQKCAFFDELSHCQ
ncbi:hypothetical protein WH367_22700 [Comamonas sp. MYb21]